MQIKFSERDNSMSKIQAGRTIVGYQTDIIIYYKRSYASKKKQTHRKVKELKELASLEKQMKKR